jgi:hypothetical protein
MVTSGAIKCAVLQITLLCILLRSYDDPHHQLNSINLTHHGIVGVSEGEEGEEFIAREMLPKKVMWFEHVNLN